MTSAEIIALAPVVIPVATALIGLLTPSPGPTVVRWSRAWWASLVQRLVAFSQSKPVQALEAQEISPAMQAIINQAVAAALAAMTAAQVPANVWLPQSNTTANAGTTL
jgi:hypothetical protein